uniref:Uncharacterized protein n=1 Tax=Cucumis melo TaxID=3656 RepID=A0A9I9CV54_CUCME
MTPILEREVKEHKDESEATKAIVVGRDLQRIQRYRVMIHAERVQSPLDDHLQGLIEPNNDESLTGPQEVDSINKEVGTSMTPVAKSIEQSLHSSTFLEEIR